MSLCTLYYFCSYYYSSILFFFFFSSRRRHTRLQGDWSSDVCSSDLNLDLGGPWPGTILAPILFTNPALAFEPVDRAIGLGEDWFRFSVSDSTQPLKIGRASCRERV